MKTKLVHRSGQAVLASAFVIGLVCSAVGLVIIGIVAALPEPEYQPAPFTAGVLFS